MSTKPKMTGDLFDRIKAVSAELETLVMEARGWADARSEKWQESDAAADYDAWIYELENAMDALDAVRFKP